MSPRVTAVESSAYIHQNLLSTKIHSLFPLEKNIYENSRKKSLIKSPNGTFMELDFYLPNLNLGFEFQDSYHYITTWYSQRTLNTIAHRDKVKKENAQKSGITLIIVPCWWNGTEESLAATIEFHRPDLLNDRFKSYHHLQIPFNPQLGFFPSPSLPDVGELMVASFPIDYEFSSKIESNTWWMGEKYDGMRFCWNPRLSVVYTRYGRETEIVSSMHSALPSMYLDGEFWFGRGSFSSTGLLYKFSDINSVLWHEIRMLCFDSPSLSLQKLYYEQRYKLLLNNISKHHPFCNIATRILCNNSLHLIKFTKTIFENEGEGLILQKIRSFYEHGRNPSLIKYKAIYGDKEGMVVESNNKEIQLELPSGRVFSVPFKNVQVTPYPKKGEIVTFSYDINAWRSIPVDPIITKIRKDIDWNEVLLSHTNESQFIKETKLEKEVDLNPNNKQIPHAYWNKIENRRNFFEKYARDKGSDPFNPKFWYKERIKNISSTQGGRAVLYYHNNSVSTALIDLFPDIGLQKDKFDQWIWHDENNRRKFFEKYANDNNFNPTIAENWYYEQQNKIKSFKDANRVLRFHNKSVSQALIDLFPDIHFIKSKFERVTWDEPKKRRNFLEKFAEINGFDPLQPHHWYKILRDQITEITGGRTVLEYHGGNLSSALIDLFPEICFQKSKFERGQWQERANRRQFFETFAEQNNFNPLIADHWYNKTKEIRATKGATGILLYYQYSVSLALIELFPEINFDLKRMKQRKYS